MERVAAAPLQKDEGTGLSTLKYEASLIHPMQAIQARAAKGEKMAKRQLMAATYGAAMPMRMMMQEQVLSQFHRLPGLPSSRLGLEALAHRDESIGFEDFLNRPDESPDMPSVDAHDIMEKQLGIQVKRPF